MRGKLLGYQDVVKIMKMMLRVLLLAAASFFVYILAGGREIPVSAEKLRISLQSDKNGEGCYLFLPSFARLPDVTVLMPKGQEEGIIVSYEETGAAPAQREKQKERGALPRGRALVRAGEQEFEAEVLQSRNMPCLWVETEEPFEELEADKEKESTGKLILYLPGGRKAFQGEIEAMHGHGNSTWYENKKSWQIKLSAKASLLGMDPAKKWLLISNVKDPSMMRNKLFLDMSKECSLPGALSCEWADLYVNGEYQGLYLLAEKADIAPGRLEIGDLLPLGFVLRFQCLDSPVCDPKSPRHYFFRAVPVLLQLDKILPRLLYLCVPPEHTDFFCHVDGEHSIVNHTADHTPALLVNPVNFDRVEILPLSEAILTHTGEPMPVIRAYLQKFVKVSRGDGRAVILIGDFNQFVHM